MKGFSVLFSITLIFEACTPSDIAIETAISETQTALPTSTFTVTSRPVLPTSTSSPIATLIPTITLTSTPLPVEIVDLKDAIMRLVPAGEFMMGSDADDALAECQKWRTDCQRDRFTNEEPIHLVYLDAFYMDKYEVTNSLYKACVDAGGCEPPQKNESRNRSNYYGNIAFDNHPVVYVNWSQARTYCEWRDAKLPTEAQWEKAARGLDSRTYPWGGEKSCNNANYAVEISPDGFYKCVGETVKVDSYPYGVSPYGIYNMAGNVWEWVADWYSETYYQNSPSHNPLGPASGTIKVIRGGSWDIIEDDLRTSARGLDSDANVNYDYLGFRCAKDAVP